jgi:hypothetical protein
MDDSEKMSLNQMQAFLEGSTEVRFAGQSRAEVYGWVESTLVGHAYAGLGRRGKGLVRRYLAKMTGLSRAQIARFITCYRKTGKVVAAPYQRHQFAKRYTEADIVLLVYVDKAHGNLSGPATRRILEREYSEYGIAAYERLAKISVAQLYRLRNSTAYRKSNTTYQPTRPTVTPIGERRKPDPLGKPGFIRIDTVHQGDRDGQKGLYHVNAVDEKTQWEIIGAVAHISELWLIPLLETMLAQFPFRILGFHSDNGSEFINYAVVKLLDKLLIEQTKSRPRHCGDNGLVESKNGAVIRKNIGWGYIASEYADEMNQFHVEHLNPYVNFHRPCAVGENRLMPNGKTERIYLRWETPWEQLQQIPDYESYLRPGLAAAELERQAMAQSDTEAALEMQRAKREMFTRIRRLSA